MKMNLKRCLALAFVLASVEGQTSWSQLAGSGGVFSSIAGLFGGGSNNNSGNTTNAQSGSSGGGSNIGSVLGGLFGGLFGTSGSGNNTAVDPGTQQLADQMMTVASIFESVPFAALVGGMESVRQSGLLKQLNVGTRSPTLKMQSLPPTGSQQPKGVCYVPSMAADGTVLGGFTVCIPSAVLGIDATRTADLPRLGWEKSNQTPDVCRATLMSKGSLYDGFYCATAQYSDTSCLVSRYQPASTLTVYEARLLHNESMNNVVLKCLVETDPTTGKMKATADVSYEVSVRSVANADSSLGAQAAEVFDVLPMIFSSTNVQSFWGSYGATTNSSVSAQSGSNSDGLQVLNTLSNLFLNGVVYQTAQGSDMYYQSVAGGNQYANANSTGGIFGGFIRDLTGNSVTTTTTTTIPLIINGTTSTTTKPLGNANGIPAPPIRRLTAQIEEEAEETFTSSQSEIEKATGNLRRLQIKVERHPTVDLGNEWSANYDARKKANDRKIAAVQREMEREAAAALRKQQQLEREAERKRKQEEAAAARQAAKEAKELEKARADAIRRNATMDELIAARDAHLNGN